VRVFWWRVLHEFLPAKQILWRQHIEPVAFCEVCGDPVESIRHVLVDCTVAREFWKHIRVATGTKLPRLNSVAWTADLLLGVCSKRDRAFILPGMWRLWMMRNKRRHGEQAWSLYQAVTWARDTAFDLWTLAHPDCQPENGRGLQRWRPPNQGWTKISVDAAFYAATSSGAVVATCRDHQGSFLKAHGRWYDRVLDAGMMEGDARFEARQARLQKVYLETDSLELVQLWKKMDFQRSPVESILTEIKELSLAFSDFIFNSIGRDCNRVAHELAKQITDTNRSEVWHETPAGICDLILY